MLEGAFFFSFVFLNETPFYLELLLEPGSIPWYVVVVVIFKRERGRKVFINLTGCDANITPSLAALHRLIIVYPSRWFPIVNLPPV